MSRRKTTEEFISRAVRVHGTTYDYSKTEYVRSDDKVSIICKIHGEFYQRAHDHVYGKCHGCPKCKGDKIRNLKRYNVNDLIAKFNEIHGNKYEYNITTYPFSRQNISIMCPEHGCFLMTPNKHLYGRGCPDCNKLTSNGEEKIKKFLIDNNISFERQKQFDSLVGDYRPLKFDFYINDYNALIEYDGEFHFDHRKSFNIKILDEDEAIEKFLKIKEYDAIKNCFCIKQKIPLLRIPFSITSYKKISNEITSFLTTVEAHNNGIIHLQDFIEMLPLSQKLRKV